MITLSLWTLLFADHYAKAIDIIQLDEWGALHTVERELVIDSDVGLEQSSLIIPTSQRRKLLSFKAELRIDGKVNPAGAPRLFEKSVGGISDRTVHQLQIAGLKKGATLWYRYELLSNQAMFLNSIAWDDAIPIDYREVVIHSAALDSIQFITNSHDTKWFEFRDTCQKNHKLSFTNTNIAATNDPATISLLVSSLDEIVSFITRQYSYDNALSVAIENGGDPRQDAYLFVQNQIRYESVLLGDHDYRPNLPSEVVERRFGDCKDKALLLAQLLRNQGHTAFLTLVGPPHIQHDYPDLSRFNHMIVALPSEQGWKFLDPTVQDLPFGSLPIQLAGGLGLIMNDKHQGEWVRLNFEPQDLLVLDAQCASDAWFFQLTFSGSAKASYAPASFDSRTILEVLRHWLTPDIANLIVADEVRAEWYADHMTIHATASKPSSSFVRLSPFAVESWYQTPSKYPLVPLVLSVSFTDVLDLPNQQFVIDEPSLSGIWTLTSANDSQLRSTMTWSHPRTKVTQRTCNKLTSMYQMLIQPANVRDQIQP